MPPALKRTEPAYASIRAADIPEITGAGVRVRVIAGRVDDVEGPMVLTSPTLFAHIRLDAGATSTLSVDPTLELGLYVLDGAIDVDTPLGSGAIAVLTQGSRLTVTATKDGPADVALLGGAPVEGPFLFSGPLVMDTPERLAQAKRDYAEGRMGTLDGVPF
ncbi:MAG: pirin-like C-terminal cupin domain-containing protein [Acetobacteraceae bacterium]